jgi:hypothetical protein
MLLLDESGYFSTLPVLQVAPSHTMKYIFLALLLCLIVFAWIFIKRRQRKRAKPVRLVRVGERTIMLSPSRESFFPQSPPTFWDKHWQWTIDKLIAIAALILSAFAVYFATRR